MTRSVSLFLVCAVFCLSLMPGPSVGHAEELPGLDVYVIGHHAYVAGGLHGLYVADISSTKPEPVATVATPGEALGVYALSNFAYVADGSAGLQIVDIRKPAATKIVGSVDTPGDARGVFVFGDHACVADAHAGLQVIDVHDSRRRRIPCHHSQRLQRRHRVCVD